MISLTVHLDFDEFPDTHTCKGEDRSPHIRIEGILPNIKSLAIIAANAPEEGPSKASWLIWNVQPMKDIPAGISKVETVSAPFTALQGRNDYGTIGYRGPCPKEGETQAYIFRVYALDIDIHLPAGANWEELVKAMEGKINQTGETVALSTG